MKTPTVIEGIAIWKWLLINLLAVVFGAILYFSAFGAMAGLFVVWPLGTDPEYEKLLDQILSREERSALNEGRLGRREMLEIVFAKDKDGKLLSMLGKYVKKVNWLIVLPVANGIVFAVLGLFAGLFGHFKYVALIPAVLLWTTYPMLTSDYFATVERHHANVLVSILFQFGFVYLLAWFGRSLRNKRLSYRERGEV